MHAVGLAQVVLLNEGEDVVVENADDPQRHPVEAHGIEIHCRFLDVGHDVAFVGPAHLRLIVGEREGELGLVLQHLVVGAADAAHGHGDVFHLVAIEARLVEIELNAISLYVRLVAKFTLVECDQAVQVLSGLQRLAEKQGGLPRSILDLETDRHELVFGIHSQAALDLRFGTDILAVEQHFNLIVSVFAGHRLQHEIVHVVAQIVGLDLILAAGGLVEDLYGILSLDGRGEGHKQLVAHHVIGFAHRIDGG